MASSIQSHTVHIETEHVDIHYLECVGPKASEEAILLIHGWPTSSFLYRKMMPALSAHHRVIALDLPGFGRSTKDRSHSFSFRYHGRILTSLVEQLGIRRVHIVVHDLGGPIGLWWALQEQERIVSYVMLNTVVFPPFSRAVKLFVMMSILPFVRNWLSSPAGIRFAMRLGIVDRSVLTPEVMQGYQSPFSGTADDKSARKSLLKSAHSLHMNGFKDVAKKLGEITQPTCLIFGEQDRILPKVQETMKRFQELIPHASKQTIPDCGHFLQEEQPEAVAAYMSDFYQQIAAG